MYNQIVSISSSFVVCCSLFLSIQIYVYVCVCVCGGVCVRIDPESHKLLFVLTTQTCSGDTSLHNNNVVSDALTYTIQTTTTTTNLVAKAVVGSLVCTRGNVVWSNFLIIPLSLLFILSYKFFFVFCYSGSKDGESLPNYLQQQVSFFFQNSTLKKTFFFLFLLHALVQTIY